MAVRSTAETRAAVERRRSERAPVTVRIEYATVDALFSDFTRDINEGGIFVETDGRFRSRRRSSSSSACRAPRKS